MHYQLGGHMGDPLAYIEAHVDIRLGSLGFGGEVTRGNIWWLARRVLR